MSEFQGGPHAGARAFRPDFVVELREAGQHAFHQPCRWTCRRSGCRKGGRPIRGPRRRMGLPSTCPRCCRGPKRHYNLRCGLRGLAARSGVCRATRGRREASVAGDVVLRAGVRHAVTAVACRAPDCGRGQPLRRPAVRRDTARPDSVRDGRDGRAGGGGVRQVCCRRGVRSGFNRLNQRCGRLTRRGAKHRRSVAIRRALIPYDANGRRSGRIRLASSWLRRIAPRIRCLNFLE